MRTKPNVVCVFSNRSSFNWLHSIGVRRSLLGEQPQALQKPRLTKIVVLGIG